MQEAVRKCELVASSGNSRQGGDGRLSECVCGGTGCGGHGEPGRTKDISHSLARLWFSKHV